MQDSGRRLQEELRQARQKIQDLERAHEGWRKLELEADSRAERIRNLELDNCSLREELSKMRTQMADALACNRVKMYEGTTRIGSDTCMTAASELQKLRVKLEHIQSRQSNAREAPKRGEEPRLEQFGNSLQRSVAQLQEQNQHLQAEIGRLTSKCHMLEAVQQSPATASVGAQGPFVDTSRPFPAQAPHSSRTSSSSGAPTIQLFNAQVARASFAMQAAPRPQSPTRTPVMTQVPQIRSLVSTTPQLGPHSFRQMMPIASPLLSSVSR